MNAISLRPRGSIGRRWSLLALGGVACIAAAGLDWQHYAFTKLPNPPVPCPSRALTVAVFGQSDAANSGDRRRVGPPGSYQFAGGRCYRLRDPVVGGTGGGGSIWPVFAAKLDRPVVIVSAALGGASIRELSGAPLSRLRRELASARAQGLELDLTVFMQGDTDAVQRTPARVYLHRLRTIRNALPGPWIVTEGAFCTPGDPQAALAAARRQLAASDRRVLVGPDLDILGTAFRRDDRCHFNREGLDAAAGLIADAVHRGFYPEPSPRPAAIGRYADDASTPRTRPIPIAPSIFASSLMRNSPARESSYQQ